MSRGTNNALFNDPGVCDEKGQLDNATFLKKVVAWWKILNVSIKGGSNAGSHQGTRQFQI